MGLILPKNEGFTVLLCYSLLFICCDIFLFYYIYINYNIDNNIYNYIYHKK